MQCPFCSSELNRGSISCKACGARQATQRTPVGIFTGWLGIILSLVWAPLLAGLLILPFTDRGLSDFPWFALIVAALIAAGLFWHSKSTLHTKWIRKED